MPGWSSQLHRRSESSLKCTRYLACLCIASCLLLLLLLLPLLCVHTDWECNKTTNGGSTFSQLTRTARCVFIYPWMLAALLRCAIT